MREFSGSLAGESWRAWMPERPEDLAHFVCWVSNQREPVACDTETKGLDILGGDPEYIRLVQFGTRTEAWVIPVELGEAFREACRFALGVLPDLTGHNWAGFDAVALAAYLGTDLQFLCRKAVDTQILAKLIDPRGPQEGGVGAGLKPLSAHYIDAAAPDTQGGLTAVFRSLKLTKSTGWAGIDLFHPIYCEYAALDVILTSRLRPLLLAELDRRGVRKRLIAYEHEISRVCAVMQQTGMILDREYTEALDVRLGNEAAEHEARAAGYGVSNVNAPAQLREAFAAMGEEWLPAERTASGMLKVDKQVLYRFADIDPKRGGRMNLRAPNPLAEAIIHSKRAGKWRSAYTRTFLETADSNGRIHPFVQTLAARTGRMSITRPALQTLPSHDDMIRRCLLAEPGHVIGSTDFQAIEMRVLAALADVKKMKHGFQNASSYSKEEYPKGFDIHMYTARMVKGPGATDEDRGIFKGAGFGKVYGGGVATLARQTGASEAEISRAVAAYDREYPEIKRQSLRWQREARETGMVHVSVTGRLLPLDRERAYAVVNYACQSAARDVLGQSLLNIENAGLLPHLRLPIHDEVVYSAPAADAPDIAREIERCMTFDLFGVPITADSKLGKRSWGSLYGSAE